MKKTIFFLSVIFVSSIYSQKITTSNGTNNPTIAIDRNLNFTNNGSIMFNGSPIIRLFGSGTAPNSNLGFGLNSGNLGTPTSPNLGNNNVSIGINTSGNTLSGQNNVFVGTNSGYQAIGEYNTGLGTGTLGANTGSYNLGMGANNGSNNTGNFNNIIGYTAGRNNKGDNNTYIGRGSSYDLLITGSDNIFLGNYSATNLLGVNRGTAIGYFSRVDLDDAISLGNATITVKIGMGTTIPSAKLHVVGGSSVATGVRFQNLPIDASGGLATQYVVIDTDGNLYRYTGTAPLRQGVDENSNFVDSNFFSENWTLKNDYLINKNKKGIIIGSGINILPKGFNMYVADGILTEKVKVALKNTSDWADYVFDKNYKRPTLLEVDKFINKYKHLPNVPTSTEMAEKGNELHKTDVKLLEKIEELTLYLIEHDKKIERLINENKILIRHIRGPKSKSK